MRCTHGDNDGKYSHVVNTGWAKEKEVRENNVGRTCRFSLWWGLRYVGVGKLEGVVWKEKKWW